MKSWLYCGQLWKNFSLFATLEVYYYNPLPKQVLQAAFAASFNIFLNSGASSCSLGALSKPDELKHPSSEVWLDFSTGELWCKQGARLTGWGGLFATSETSDSLKWRNVRCRAKGRGLSELLSWTLEVNFF